MDTSNIGGLIASLVTLPFIIVMLVLIVVYARSARKATASKNWPTTTGRIISSDVGSYRSRRSSGTHTTVYEPNIVYEYSADGQRFQSKQISFGAVAGTSSTGWAENIVTHYPEGGTVQVFYNPANPSEAVLEHSGAGGNLALMLVFVVIEAVLVGILISGLTGHFG